MCIGRLNRVLESRLLFSECVKVSVGLSVSGVDFIQPGQGIDRLCQSFLNVAADIFFWVKLWLLCKVANLDPRLRTGLALNIRVDARHNLEQCRFSRAIEAQHANFGAGEERE